MLSDPNPSFTKKARRSNSLPDSAGVIFFSSDIGFLERLLRTSSRNWRFGPERSVDRFNRNQSGALGRSQIVRLHRDGANGTTRRAQSAANTASLVFQHGGTGHDAEFVGCDFIKLHAKQFLMLKDLLHGFGLKLNAIQRDKRQAVFGANIHRSEEHT